MKKWVQKLVSQFQLENNDHHENEINSLHLSEDRATLLFLLDIYSKNLIETDHSPVRKVRETLDDFSKNLLTQDDETLEKTYFHLRQFISGYRIEEFTYVNKTFDELRKIIWDLIEHLGQDMSAEQSEESIISENLESLREAVESNSIDLLKIQSKKFIHTYLKTQTDKKVRKENKISKIKKNMTSVKKQLVEANNNLKLDHLTKAYNRKNFDEQTKHYWNLFQVTQQPVSLIILDIDFFKKINDTYGHAMGDFVLIECVRILKSEFTREIDCVFRIGGEEFAILLPDYNVESALVKANEILEKVRKETIIDKDVKVQFTLSMGLGQLMIGENLESWIKRADSALYEAKNTGRNKIVVSHSSSIRKVS